MLMLAIQYKTTVFDITLLPMVRSPHATRLTQRASMVELSNYEWRTCSSFTQWPTVWTVEFSLQAKSSKPVVPKLPTCNLNMPGLKATE